MDARSAEAGLSLPAFVRTCCDLPAWISRGSEMAGRRRPAARRPKMALERLAVTVVLTEAERVMLRAQAGEARTTLPQYLRTRCGFEFRSSSLPNTIERDREEDDAWGRLQRLGLDPQGYFGREG
ncbi:MAG: hypothetical protein KJZ84_24920 [Bryobacteraceae bacterium]|nr:hypothetical protein [Bryobacteraceae bacterium]